MNMRTIWCAGALTIALVAASFCVGCLDGAFASDTEPVTTTTQPHSNTESGEVSTQVGRKGDVVIDLAAVETSGQKQYLSESIIKKLGLEKLLLRGVVPEDSDGKKMSLDELLRQKLQRLEARGKASAIEEGVSPAESSERTEVSGASDDTAAAADESGVSEAEASEASSETLTEIETVPPDEFETQEAMPPYKEQLYDTGILDINDTYVEYVDSFLASEAPEEGAALWAGSDAVDDGFLGYFIGHNPGDFTPVLSLTIGDPITVYDRFGDERTYHVVDTFIVPNTSRFIDIEERLFGYGESIALQTCLDDNQNFLVVVAA